MRVRSAFLIAFAALVVAVPGTAAAAVPAPTPGITARQVGDMVTLTFSADALAAAHLRTGATLSGACASVPGGDGIVLAAGDIDPQFGFGTGKLGGDGTAALDLGAYAEKGDPPLGVLDICQVGRYDARTDRLVQIASIALTAQGTARYEDDRAAAALKAALVRAQTSTGFNAATAVGGVVPLASPDASPTAPGQVGYWTDGRAAIAVTITPSLRRVFFEDDGHGTARFNLPNDATTLFYDAISGLAARAMSDGRSAETEKGRPPYGQESEPQLTSDGLRLSRSGRRVTVRFTGHSAKAYRKIAHRKVRLSCVTAPADRVVIPKLTAATEPRVATAVVRVPRHGGVVTARLSRTPGDVCQIWDDGAMVVFAGLDATGRRWLQDAVTVEMIGNAGAELNPAAPGGRAYRSAAQIVAKHRRQYVALATAGATPPVGRVGVWSDGAQSYEVVAVSPTGHRYVIADQGSSVVRSNVMPANVALQATIYAGYVG
jgi:hypothetical protein